MKIVFLSFFFFVMFFGFVSATPISLDFEKNSYFPGETIQGIISYDNSFQGDIKQTDFYLDLNGSTTNVFPVLKDFNGLTYFYFNVPSGLTKGDYNLFVENVAYLDSGILTQDNFGFNISINERNGSIVSIFPGYLFLNYNLDNTFNLDFNNPSLDSTIVDISNEDDFLVFNKKSFSLESGSSNSVQGIVFPFLVNKNNSLIKITYDELSYEIPVFILGFSEENMTSSNSNNSDLSLIILEDSFDISIEEGDSSSGFIKVYNNLGSDINDVEFILSDSLKEIVDLEHDKLSFKDGETIKNHIYVNENKNSSVGNYSGEISLIYNGEEYDSVSININLLFKEVKNETSNNSAVPNTDEEVQQNDNLYLILFVIGIVVLIFSFIAYRYYKSKKREL